ncbi:MAG: polyprenyl synthetase family protein [Candidatus Diapherotrites archaeon]|nr:polyprenyl synthetase family protein [Candidatus Diapherotrites archaeon]
MPYERMKAFFAEWVPKIDRELYAFLEKKVKEQTDPYNKRVVDDIYRFAKAGGKRVRPTLVIAGYLGARESAPNEVIKASIAYELLHIYLLIHDDIVDRDELRRGQPTVWKSMMDHYVRGDLERHDAEALATIGGDLAETYATLALLNAGLEPETAVNAVRELHEIAERTGYGQVLDVSLEMTPIEDVREEDVLRVHELKTAKYTMEGPLHMGAQLANAPKEIFDAYSKYAVPVGIAFQLQDDIIGVFGDEKKTGKPVGSDIREGKRTLLIVKAYENATDAQKKLIKAVLGRESATAEEIEEIKDIIMETGSLDYSKKLMEELMERGIASLETAPIKEEVKDVLRDLAEYIIKRDR